MFLSPYRPHSHPKIESIIAFFLSDIHRGKKFLAVFEKNGDVIAKTARMEGFKIVLKN